LKFVKIGSIEQLHVNGKQQKQENSSDIIFSVILRYVYKTANKKKLAYTRFDLGMQATCPL